MLMAKPTHLNNDLESRWELELFDLLLEQRRLRTHLDKGVELRA